MYNKFIYLFIIFYLFIIYLIRLELTCPNEKRIQDAHEFKLDKYVHAWQLSVKVMDGGAITLRLKLVQEDWFHKCLGLLGHSSPFYPKLVRAMVSLPV